MSFYEQLARVAEHTAIVIGIALGLGAYWCIYHVFLDGLSRL